MTLTTSIALYAAIVSTVSLTLSARKWLITGPRLVLSVMPRGKAIGGAGQDDNEYVVLTVTNRGDLATTLTTMAAFRYHSIFHRWRRRPFWAAIVANPAITGGQNAPYLISPGDRWMGMAKYDDKLLELAKSGKLFIAIHASHSNRPFVKKVRWSETAAEKTARLAAVS